MFCFLTEKKKKKRNGGNCSISGSSAVCACAPGFSGSNCRVAVVSSSPSEPPIGIIVGAVIGAVVLGVGAGLLVYYFHRKSSAAYTMRARAELKQKEIAATYVMMK